MSGDKLTVYVPCEVATVRVRLGYQETLTPIEQVVLKAVYAGADTLSALCDVLGMSRRLTLDVVQDLWRTGYLRLINSYAGIEVTEAIAAAVAADRLGRLSSAETLVDERQVMIDKLSGYVMPAHGPHSPAQPKLAVPVENSSVRIGGAESADLLGAIERDLAREDNQNTENAEGRPVDTRRRRVLGAYLNGTGLRSAGRRWLPLEIQTARDPDSDQLLVAVTDTRLPETYRIEASRQLTRLVASRPMDPFVQALQAKPAPGLLSAPSLTRAVARLRDQTATAATIPAGQRVNWHGQLAAHYQQLRGMLDSRVAGEGTARIVTGAEHPDLVVELIRSARRQLVIACPWIGYDALNALSAELRAALARRVQVVLLWGIGYQDTLDPRVSNLLYQIALDTGARSAAPADTDDEPPRPAAGAPRFLVPETAARTHAKVVVADDTAALVTSWNMLNRATPRDEVGIHFTAPASTGAAGSRPVRDILRWARTAIPGYEMSRLMLVTERDFASVARRSAEPDPDRLPQFPDVPEAPVEGIDEAADQAARKWSENWQYVAGQVAAQVTARSLPSADVVVDGAHRQVLWDALRDARHRLVITSDRVSARVLDERMLDALGKAAAREVAITIRYGRPDDRERGLDPVGAALSNAPTPAEQALSELAAAYPAQVRVLRGDNHAKMLVWDDEAVVSSFNFLSFEGSYDAAAAHRQRSEVGLRLSGRAVADDAARAAGALVAEIAESTSVRSAPEYDSTFTVAQRILTDVSGGGDPASVITEHLDRDGVRPWDVLDRLAQDTARPLLRVAAAHCLSRHAGTAPPGRRNQWLRWLVEDFWADGSYPEAALLRELVDDDALAPGREITRLAAARGLAPYAEILAEAWTATVADAPAGAPAVPMTASTAVLVAAMEHILLSGDSAAETMLELSRETLGAGWLPLADAVLAYAEASFHRPLPLAQIRDSLDRREELTEQSRLWAQLDLAFERAAHTPLANSHSTRTLRELLDEGKGGVFAELAGRVRARDITAIAGRLSPALPGRKELERLIDDASHTVDDSKEPIHGDHRRRLVRQLTSITADARALVAIYAESGGLGEPAGPDEAKHLDAARELAVVVRAELPDLIVAADAATSPESRFVREVLEGLTVLQEWAELRSEPATGSAA